MSQVKWQNIAGKKNVSVFLFLKDHPFCFSFFLLKNIIILFIFGWAGSSLLHAGFTLVAVNRATL